ncbi:MAG: hypothetical protein IPP46_07685 [Bacteroidetes bacterium]|nr:hypothetical protein [Bacteroidota bacterium]
MLNEEVTHLERYEPSESMEQTESIIAGEEEIVHEEKESIEEIRNEKQELSAQDIVTERLIASTAEPCQQRRGGGSGK